MRDATKKKTMRKGIARQKAKYLGDSAGEESVSVEHDVEQKPPAGSPNKFALNATKVKCVHACTRGGKWTRRPSLEWQQMQNTNTHAGNHVMYVHPRGFRSQSDRRHITCDTDDPNVAKKKEASDE